MPKKTSLSPPRSIPNYGPADIAADEEIVRRVEGLEHATDVDLFDESQALARLKKSRNFKAEGTTYDTYIRTTFGIQTTDRSHILAIGDSFTREQLAGTTLGKTRLHAITRARNREESAALLGLCQKTQPPKDRIEAALELAAEYPASRRIEAMKNYLLEQTLPRKPASTRKGPQRAAAAKGNRRKHTRPVSPADRALQLVAELRGLAGVSARDLAALLPPELKPFIGDLNRELSPSPAKPAERRDITPAAPSPIVIPAVHRPPASWSQYHFRVPVFCPPEMDPSHLTEADRVVCTLNAALGEFARLTYQIDWDLDRWAEVAVHLQFLAVREFYLCAEERRPLLGLMDTFCDNGRLLLESRLAELQRQRPGRELDIDTVFPQPTDPRTPLPPLDTFIYEATPPLQLPDANRTEKLIFRAMGLSRFLRATYPKWLDCYERDIEHTDVLLYQLRCMLELYSFSMTRIAMSMEDDAEEGRKIEEARLAQAAYAAEHRDWANTHCVTLGDTHLSKRHVKIGLTIDGRLVALTLSLPQFILLLGNVGMGKTHLMRLIAEGASIELDGLSRLGQGPSRVVCFSADWREGQANHAMLSGFYPNSDLRHHQFLLDTFGASTSNAAYIEGQLLCLPGMGAYYQQIYPDLIERGLQIIEQLLHPGELGPWGISVLNAHGDGKYRTQAAQWLDAMVSQYGPDLDLDQLIADVDDSDLNSHSRASLIEQLRIIKRLTSPHGHLLDVMELPGPKFVIHESPWMPQAMILPLQMVMMNVWSRALRNGQDPHRIFQLDELTKYLVSLKLLEYLEGLAVEVRHRPVTTVLGAQRVKNLPEGILALATITGVFNIQSPGEFKKAQQGTGLLYGVSHEEQVRTLRRGQVLMGSLVASDPRFVEQTQLVNLRPAAMDPGGETFEIG